VSDIVHDIDALIDESLAGGEPRTGYDYGDPTYPRCPHCDRSWHGLPLTDWIVRMYERGQFDEDYTAATDQSRVLCQGSEFIGPQPAPLPGIYGGRRPLWWFNPNPSWQLDAEVVTTEMLVSQGWTVCGALREDIETVPSHSPRWLDDLIDYATAYTAEALGIAFEIPLTLNLWRPGDHYENRALPMPLRYAARHPQSPRAILDVLAGGQ
jgi:hypothetical protein